MQSAQTQRTARLLRRALEAALPPGGVVDAVANRVEELLPKRRKAELVLRDTEVEPYLYPGRDRRRPRFPSTESFDPYPDLFMFGRVKTRPWDMAWKKTPLVFHDVDLLHVVDFPPYLEAEPHEHGDSIVKILEHHRGPVELLRVDASKLPPLETLGRWLDLLSAQSVTELTFLDVGAPPARDKAAWAEFPLSRLRCPGLARLALGFVTVRFGTCCWSLSGLQALFLVSCGCSGRDLSDTVASLAHLKTLAILGVDLAPAGAGATAAATGDGALEIESESLSSLELTEATATALILLHAPGLKSLVAGVFPPEVKNWRVRPRNVDARPPVSIRLRYAPDLQSISGLVLSRRQRISPVGPLSELETLEVSFAMGVPEQWTQLLNLAAQLPGLRCLHLTRVDDCRGYEELELEPCPACFRDSLQQLHLHDYRAGGAEVSLVTKVLATGQHLLSIKLYPHSGSPGLAHLRYIHCPRLSAGVRVESCQSGW